MFVASKLFKISNCLFAPFFNLDVAAWLLLDTIESFLNHLTITQLSPLPPGVFLKNPETIFIGNQCSIEPGSYIEGPCYIGDRTEVRHAAYIRKGSIIGNDCVIGHGSEINRSLILDGAKLAHFNYVGDSIIGEDVNLGAGTKCANLRLDEKEIAIVYKKERFLTGRKKLGALIGYGAATGCNSVLNPGSIIFPNAKIAPCQAVKGVIL